MPVYKSKFTKGITADETCFSKGETVRYQLRSGGELDIIIDSERMYVKDNGEVLFGYESIFSDDNQRYFACEKGIINWEGKC